jgi:hypothetical protein
VPLEAIEGKNRLHHPVAKVFCDLFPNGFRLSTEGIVLSGDLNALPTSDMLKPKANLRFSKAARKG